MIIRPARQRPQLRTPPRLLRTFQSDTELRQPLGIIGNIASGETLSEKDNGNNHVYTGNDSIQVRLTPAVGGGGTGEIVFEDLGLNLQGDRKLGFLFGFTQVGEPIEALQQQVSVTVHLSNDAAPSGNPANRTRTTNLLNVAVKPKFFMFTLHEDDTGWIDNGDGLDWSKPIRYCKIAFTCSGSSTDERRVTLDSVYSNWSYGDNFPIFFSLDDQDEPQYSYFLPKWRNRGWECSLLVNATLSGWSGGNRFTPAEVPEFIQAGFDLVSHANDHTAWSSSESVVQQQARISETQEYLRANGWLSPKAEVMFGPPNGDYADSTMQACENLGIIYLRRAGKLHINFSQWHDTFNHVGAMVARGSGGVAGRPDIEIGSILNMSGADSDTPTFAALEPILDLALKKQTPPSIYGHTFVDSAASNREWLKSDLDLFEEWMMDNKAFGARLTEVIRDDAVTAIQRTFVEQYTGRKAG